MKRLLLNIAFAFAFLPAMAQNSDSGVRFVLLGVDGDEVPQATSSAIDTKLRQALNRTSALTDDSDGVFAVRPTLTISEAAATEGLMQDVNRIRAELVLQAVNQLDGNVFYSVTVPLSATATGSRNDALRKLATSMKSTDPVYVRFVRTARQKIDAYYTDNCATILQRAQTLADTGKGPQAARLLEAVPAEADCYQQARMLLAELGGTPAVLPDTVVVEQVVEVPVEVPVVVEVPAPAPAPAPVPAAVPQAASPRIKLSHPDAFSFKVISCTGVRIGEQGKITAEIVNKDMRFENNFFRLQKAFDADGNAFNRDNLSVNGYSNPSVSTPRSIKAKLNFTITGVNPQVKEFSYLYIDFDQYVVEIYDLPINWINE